MNGSMRLLALGVVVTATGCGAGVGHVAHPLMSGGASNANPQAKYAIIANEYQQLHLGARPGALAETAEIASATADEVCILAHTISDKSSHSNYSEWNHRLKVNGDNEHEVAIARATLISVEPYEVAGNRYETRQSGSTTHCTSKDRFGNCERWENSPNYYQYAIPETFHMVKRDVKVCFAGVGLSVRSTGLELISTPTMGVDARAMNFKWKFE